MTPTPGPEGGPDKGRDSRHICHLTEAETAVTSATLNSYGQQPHLPHISGTGSQHSPSKEVTMMVHMLTVQHMSYATLTSPTDV